MECQGFYPVIVGSADGLTIATGERFGLVLPASSIDWPHGVDDELGRQASAGGDDGFAGGECADFVPRALAPLDARGPRRGLDGSIHASAAGDGRRWAL